MSVYVNYNCRICHVNVNDIFLKLVQNNTKVRYNVCKICKYNKFHQIMTKGDKLLKKQVFLKLLYELDNKRSVCENVVKNNHR